jgi:hypothetical protein
MHSTLIDALVRCWGTRSRRDGLLLLAGGGLAALLTRLDHGSARERQKHKKRRKKCKGNTQKCGKKCIPKSNCCTNPDCGPGGACLDGACFCLSGFRTCQFACVPEDEGCCNAPECEAGQNCLANDSCATACTLGSTVCGGGCTCSVENMEGLHHCVETVFCDDIPQTCASTAECPRGQQCQRVVCNGGLATRCVPLCPS